MFNRLRVFLWLQFQNLNKSVKDSLYRLFVAIQSASEEAEGNPDENYSFSDFIQNLSEGHDNLIWMASHIGEDKALRYTLHKRICHEQTANGNTHWNPDTVTTLLGETALLHAIAKNHSECAKLLIKYGANTNTQSNNGDINKEWAINAIKKSNFEVTPINVIKNQMRAEVNHWSNKYNYVSTMFNSNTSMDKRILFALKKDLKKYLKNRPFVTFTDLRDNKETFINERLMPQLNSYLEGKINQINISIDECKYLTDGDLHTTINKYQAYFEKIFLPQISKTLNDKPVSNMQIL